MKKTYFPAPPIAKNLPKVAILLCTYDGETYLADQMNSFAAQSHTNWEVWASDDGSRDNTYSLLESFREQWGADRLSILPGPAKGYVANFLSLTCNTNIQADYYAYSDQDDIWVADKLERALRWLQCVPNGVPALYCSRTSLINEKSELIGQSALFNSPRSFANALIQSLAGGNTMVFNNATRELACRAGCDLDVVSHDWWLYILVSGCGGKVNYDTRPSLLYRQHDANLVGMDTSWSARFGRISRLFSDFYKNRNNRNIKEIQKIRFMFTPENQRVLDLFTAARSQGFLSRLIGIKKSGVYCQTVYGNLSLIAATILKKI